MPRRLRGTDGHSSSIVAGEATARADVYGFLASVFRSHPDEDSVHALRALAAELGIAWPSEFSLAELDREYMDLFVVPGPRYLAPYESVFRDELAVPTVLRRGSNPTETGRTVKGLLMGESTLRVRGYYLQAGLLPEEDLPDHIGNELRFLAYVCAREAEAPPDEAWSLAELRKKFCHEHIFRWIARLRERVTERERLGYYAVALKVAEAVLHDDVD